MYVCICNALKEADFKRIALAHPEATAEEAFALLGTEPDCGSCVLYAREVMRKAREHPDTAGDSLIA